MSAFIAVAIITVEYENSIIDLIKDQLDLPDLVKQNLKTNLLPYLRAIQLDGYEKYKKRKLMIVGNTSK